MIKELGLYFMMILIPINLLITKVMIIKIMFIMSVMQVVLVWTIITEMLKSIMNIMITVMLIILLVTVNRMLIVKALTLTTTENYLHKKK